MHGRAAGSYYVTPRTYGVDIMTIAVLCDSCSFLHLSYCVSRDYRGILYSATVPVLLIAVTVCIAFASRLDQACPIDLIHAKI